MSTPPLQKVIIYLFIIVGGKTKLRQKANGDTLTCILLKGLSVHQLYLKCKKSN